MAYSYSDVFKAKDSAKNLGSVSGELASASEEDINSHFTHWSALLAEMSNELRLLAGSTEDEFLAIGDRLHDFYERSGSIRNLSGLVTVKVDGKEVHSAIQELSALLDQMRECLDEAEHDAELDCNALDNVLHLLDKVSAPLDGFKKINKVLRMLGISTKIESARLGQSAAGFDTLAEDVGNLSVQVLEKSETILAEQLKLSITIRNTLASVKAIEAEQRVKVRSILDKTEESMALLKEVNSRCSALASVVAIASDEVSQGISGVVTSMQFHDIVRQIIEHVQTTLSELSSRACVAASSSSTGVNESDLVVEIGDICVLEAAQLEKAGDEIRTAISDIIENLKRVAHMGACIAGETRDLAGVSDKAGSSFFIDMEHELEQVASSLFDSAKANHFISQAMNAVAATVSEIVNFVADIENVGEEIELIAMNAQIKAARTGEEGAALGVLAEAIQKLSVEAQQQTSAVSDTLRSITNTTDNLFRGVESEVKSLDKRVDLIEGEFHGLLESLRLLNENLLDNIAVLEKEVDLLSEEIENTTSSITVHLKISAELDKVIRSLEDIIAKTSRVAPVGSDNNREMRLKGLAARYTMHSERKIHQMVAGGTRHGNAGAPISGVDADDLGSNIEMF